MNNKEFLYRCELFHDNFQGSFINLTKLEIISETPKGYWVQLKWGRKRWVSSEARNKYACKSEKEAYKQFVRRKTYRNRCIISERNRNDTAIIQAKEKIKEYDKQGKERNTK